MPAHSPPPNGVPPEAVLLRLAWEHVQATARPRLDHRLDPRPVRVRRVRWGRRRGGNR
jgi:hypothetical protein